MTTDPVAVRIVEWNVSMALHKKAHLLPSWPRQSRSCRNRLVPDETKASAKNEIAIASVKTNAADVTVVDLTGQSRQFLGQVADGGEGVEGGVIWPGYCRVSKAHRIAFARLGAQ